MNKFTPSMFESIKSALQKNSQTTSSYKDIIRLTPGNNYIVRLLPNIADPSKTFFHYYSVGWTSFSTGQYISYTSPSTFGERDPVLEAKYRILRTEGTDADSKKKAESIIRSEKWLVNAYVVKNPAMSENEGKVMILRYGKQLHKIIMDAIEGEGSEDYGSRIFDLTSNGCNFVIKAEKQGEYPTYVSSKFSMPKPVENLDESKIDTVYNSSVDLTTVLPVKSFDEIQQLLNEHFFCKDESTSSVQPVRESTVIEKAATPFNKSVSDMDDLDDNKVQELLNGLNDI